MRRLYASFKGSVKPIYRLEKVESGFGVLGFRVRGEWYRGLKK